MSNKSNKNSVVNSPEKLDVRLHGECMVFLSKLPSGAKLRPRQAIGYEIVAPSESTKNHHVVDTTPEGVDFYEDDKGTMFMVSSVETTIFCVQTDRHDAIALPAGTYEFGSQLEYDPFEARLRAVRD